MQKCGLKYEKKKEQNHLSSSTQKHALLYVQTAENLMKIRATDRPIDQLNAVDSTVARTIIMKPIIGINYAITCFASFNNQMFETNLARLMISGHNFVICIFKMNRFDFHCVQNAPAFITGNLVFSAIDCFMLIIALSKFLLHISNVNMNS